ncbi:hypothetical protein JCM19992_08280 [Thermostilla marina]
MTRVFSHSGAVSRVRGLITLCLVGAVVFSAGPAVAQWGMPFPPGNTGRMNQQRRPQQNQLPSLPANLPRVEASGTVMGVTGGMIQLQTPAGQMWRLAPARECKITVTGKAKPDVLRPGQFVAFVADVDTRTGMVPEKVTQLKIFTVSQQMQLGVFPEGQAPLGDGNGEAGPGVGGRMPGLGGVGGAPTGRPLPGRAPAAPVEPIQRFEVRGRLTGVSRTGEFTLAAPNAYIRGPIRFSVAEEADVELEISGPSAAGLIHKGDAVTATGVQVGPNMAQVRELNVELAEPLSAAKPERPGATATGTTRRETPRRGTPSRLPEKEDDPFNGGGGDDQPPARAGVPLPPIGGDASGDGAAGEEAEEPPVEAQPE